MQSKSGRQLFQGGVLRDGDGEIDQGSASDKAGDYQPDHNPDVVGLLSQYWKRSESLLGRLVIDVWLPRSWEIDARNPFRIYKTSPTSAMEFLVSIVQLIK